MKRHTLFILLFLLCNIAFAVEPVLNVFSLAEKSHLRVPTPGLFSKNKSFTIHFSDLSDNDFCYPLPGGKVISGYGARRNHTGHDIKTKANDTIRCVFNGVVRMAKKYGGYGNLVVVRHENGLESAYSHNSKNFVKVGDVVKAGDPIGLTGRTGRATTEHLHFEFRVNGQHINPNLILNTKNHSLNKTDLICTKTNTGVSVKSTNKR